MRLNRRNVLVGLGTIVAGGGAALGTGAFSSMSADRTVTIDTEGDGAALLSLVVDDDNYNGLNGGDQGAGDMIELNFEKLNQNAETTFNNALTIDNNGNETIDVSLTDLGNLDGILSITPGSVTLQPDGNRDGEDSMDVDITVDLREKDVPTNPDNVTFLAEPNGP